MRDRVRVAITDKDSEYHNRVVNLVSHRFDIELVDTRPDVVFFGVYPGYEVLKHSEAIRVFASQENVVPDFNIADYALGYAHLTFGPRYLRVPNFCFYDRHESSPPRPLERPRDKFCNFIYSHDAGQSVRSTLFEAMNGYKPVESRGAYLNNAPALALPTEVEGWHDAKLAELSRYKFTLAIENCATPGYVTEKLSDALKAGTVPIYWGDPDVSRTFNPDRMIVVQDIGDLGAVLERVRHLDEDEAEYRRVVALPIVTDAQESPPPSSEQILSFLERPMAKVAARNRQMWGWKYEHRLREMVRSERRIEVLRGTVDRLGMGRLARALAKRPR